jgi:adenine phosphoribosyltransferase
MAQLIEVDAAEQTRVEALLETHPDFPHAGITFVDIMPLFRSAETMRSLTRLLAAFVRARFPGVGALLGLESRGFLFGTLLAAELGVGFAPIRKKGKLPGHCTEASYTLEYGTSVVEMQVNHGFPPGTKALLVDDLLATGGASSRAACPSSGGGGGSESVEPQDTSHNQRAMVTCGCPRRRLR